MSRLGSRLQEAQSQISILNASLEQANRRAVDASAHWERELQEARGHVVRNSVAIQDQRQTWQRALDAERDGRRNDLQQAGQLLQKLEATSAELLHRGQDLHVTKATADQTIQEAHRNAEFSVNHMEAAMRRKLSLWQRNSGDEIAKLKFDLDAAQRGAAMGVSAAEADRSHVLVATLWHAAGRREFFEGNFKVCEQQAEESLNAWRLYFHRDVGAERPLLKPSSELLLGPMRAVAGPRAAEVLGHLAGPPGIVQPPKPAYAGPPAPPL